MPVWRAESARPGDRLQISRFVCDQVGLLPAEFLIRLGLPHHAKLLDLTRRMRWPPDRASTKARRVE